MTVNDIDSTVAAHYGIDVVTLRSRDKHRRIAGPRLVAFYLARRLMGWSFPELARHYERDHTTIVAGVQAVETWLAADAALTADVEALTAKLGAFGTPLRPPVRPGRGAFLVPLQRRPPIAIEAPVVRAIAPADEQQRQLAGAARVSAEAPGSTPGAGPRGERGPVEGAACSGGASQSVLDGPAWRCW